MEKQDIVNTFSLLGNGTQKKNFIIRTNIAVGKGINGTDFITYYGERNVNEKDHCHISEIHIYDGFITLEMECVSEELCTDNGNKTIVLPFGSIASIDIINKVGVWWMPDKTNVKVVVEN